MITTYIIQETTTGIHYLSTISKERAEEWLELANEGGCRGLGWPNKEYEMTIQRKPLSPNNNGLWQF